MRWASAALMVVYSMIVLAGVTSSIRDPGVALARWVCMAFLSFGLAGLFVGLTKTSYTLERLIQPIQYLILPISGVFFMVEWLPSMAHELVWYVTHVRCFMMFRVGFFGRYVVMHLTWWHSLLWRIALTALAVGLIDKVRENMYTD